MIALLPAGPTHAALLAQWGAEPHVRPYWPEWDAPVAEVRATVADRVAADHLDPWIVARDSEPVGYVETYRVLGDPLADHHPFDDGDRGFHLLVGPPELLGTGVADELADAVLQRLSAEPGVDRVVCEPDVRNTRMLRFCARHGFARIATLELPDKTAALLAVGRP